jgi:hypothetical protein
MKIVDLYLIACHPDPSKTYERDGVYGFEGGGDLFEERRLMLNS